MQKEKKEAPNEIEVNGTKVTFYGVGRLLVKVGGRTKELKAR